MRGAARPRPRVILARAGFTRSLLLRALWSASHSRSRRLCRIVRGRSVSAVGSLLLAQASRRWCCQRYRPLRSLQPGVCRTPCVEHRGPENRVVPARAGATSTSAGTPGPGPASRKLQGSHPRSRRHNLVFSPFSRYAYEALPLPRASASSSLRNAVLLQGHSRVSDSRVITWQGWATRVAPARAGVTSTATRMRRGRWRPRSLRGFSLVRRARAHSMDESLPLARALQTTADPVRVVQGHSRSTGSATLRLPSWTGSLDHPRFRRLYLIVQTRGVFRPLATRTDTSVESLPLPQAVRDGGQHAHGSLPLARAPRPRHSSSTEAKSSHLRSPGRT